MAVIDGYTLTAALFEDAYKAAAADGVKDPQSYGRQIMNTGESTHCNKVGGIIEAAVMAKAIQAMDVNISKAVKAPAKVTGVNAKGVEVFSINAAGQLSGMDILTGYAEHAPYWEGVGQALFAEIAGKAPEKPDTPDQPDQPDNPDQPDQPQGPVAVTGVRLDAYSLNLRPGRTSTLTATVVPTNAENKGVYWTSSDVKVVTVDQKGVVTAVAEGSATVTVKTDDGDFTASCDVTVKEGSSSGGSSSSRPENRPAVSGSTAAAPTTTTVTRDDGSKVVTTTKDGDKEIVVTDAQGEEIVDLKIPGTVSAGATRFVDVPAGHWAENAINTMAAMGMVKGVSDDTYDMTSSITRGSIATILHRMAGSKEGKTSAFADVAEGQWYTAAIGWAATSGVVNGYSETAFGPNDTVTRQQLAVMLARFAQLVGLDTAADKSALAAFADGAATDDWAADGMAWCVKSGILQGKGNSVLDPAAQVTRAEAAVMFDRLVSLIK